MKTKLKQSIDQLILLDKANLERMMSSGNFDKEAISKLSNHLNILAMKKNFVDKMSNLEVLDMLAELQEEIVMCKKILNKNGINVKKKLQY